MERTNVLVNVFLHLNYSEQEKQNKKVPMHSIHYLLTALQINRGNRDNFLHQSVNCDCHWNHFAMMVLIRRQNMFSFRNKKNYP